MFKNALVSCSDKSGLVEFLKPLQQSGLRIVSTGGTSALLKSHGLKIVDVAEQTGFPEILDGRVKTLNPKIHMALLARLDHPQDEQTLAHYEIEPFDLVVGNLYPFSSEPNVENIDIGGPSFLRAAAKNYERITVVCDPSDYEWIAEKKMTTLEDRLNLATKLFSHTASYDAMIAAHFSGPKSLASLPHHAIGGELFKTLRYGENAQQKALWYKNRGEEQGLHRAKIHQGKELSYNNLLDLHAAVSTLQNVSGKSICVAVKHNNPCSAAVHNESETALSNALKADPVSIFGGVLAVNFLITEKMVSELNQLFLECLIAPIYEESALERLSAKKNLRVLSWPELKNSSRTFNWRSLLGGYLIQESDAIESAWSHDWTIHGEKPFVETQNDLLLAWQVSASLKSNAIAIVSDGVTRGLGMGQVNRVDAVEQAISRCQKFHPNVKNLVLASDAFFPFPDSIERIAEAGIRWVMQPGGSVKDQEVITMAEKLGVNLVMTGKRHFLH